MDLFLSSLRRRGPAHGRTVIVVIDSPALSMVCCLGSAVAFMVVVAILGTRSKLKFAARIRRGIENGGYDEEKHPRRARHIRLYVLAASSLTAVSFLAVMVILALYAFPDLLGETMDRDSFAKAFGAWLLFSLVAVIVLSVVFNKIMGDDYE